MWSRRKTGLCIVTLLLLLVAVVRPLRQALVYPVVRHAKALEAGRPLKGFPPDQLDGYAAVLARQELDAMAARMAAQDPLEQRRQDDRIEATRIRMAQVDQERVWYHLAHHPLESAGVVVFLVGVVLALRWWLGGRGVRGEADSARTPRRLSRPLRKSPGKAIPDEEGANEGSMAGGAESGDAPGGEVLEMPLEHEIERLLDGGDGPSDPPSAQTLDPTWEGWSQAVRARMPPLEMAHLIALFASDASRNYLGLLGFLSHQLALSGSDHIRLFPARKSVQIFLSAPDKEQEIGELPPQQYAGLVVALTNALNLQPDGPTGRSSRWARLVAPSEEGYQLQEIRLYDNAIEIRAIDHVRFLPAGW